MFVTRLIEPIVAFAVANARACLFPLFIFAALALSHLLPDGVPRYDALLLACLAMQVVMVATRLETLDELKVISLFHLLGLGLESFKVHVGSWSYPEEAFTKIAGVPLYAGFMYASVASYMVQAWRLLALRFHGWPRTSVVVPLGVVIYANFFTHHTLPDVRYLAIVAVLFAFRRSWVEFEPAASWPSGTTGTRRAIAHVHATGDRARGRGRRRYRMPLVAAFAAIGLFVWIAENVATFLGAWQYPNQVSGWHVVDPWKLTSWSLLVIVSMMAVVELKRIKGARPGERQDVLADVGSAPAQPLHAHASVGGDDAANLHVASTHRVVVDART